MKCSKRKPSKAKISSNKPSTFEANPTKKAKKKKLIGTRNEEDEGGAECEMRRDEERECGEDDRGELEDDLDRIVKNVVEKVGLKEGGGKFDHSSLVRRVRESADRKKKTKDSDFMTPPAPKRQKQKAKKDLHTIKFEDAKENKDISEQEDSLDRYRGREDFTGHAEVSF